MGQTNYRATLHYNVTVRRSTKSEKQSSNLLKKATQKKRDGDLDAAIACLREAYGLMSKHTTIYPIDTYLRLPLYLQHAGRYGEAMAEFEQLLCNTPPTVVKEFPHAPREVLQSIAAMRYADIFDKVRLSTHREKHFVHSVYYMVLSLASRAVGLRLQDKGGLFRDPSWWIDRLRPLLERAGRESLLEGLVEICIRHSLSGNTQSLASFANEIKSMLKIDLNSASVNMPDVPESFPQ